MGLYKRGSVWWMSFTHNGEQFRQSTETEDKTLAKMRNPFFLDSESGFDWTVNPKITGQCFSPILPAVSLGFRCPIQVFLDSSFRIESPFIENVI